MSTLPSQNEDEEYDTTMTAMVMGKVVVVVVIFSSSLFLARHTMHCLQNNIAIIICHLHFLCLIFSALISFVTIFAFYTQTQDNFFLYFTAVPLLVSYILLFCASSELLSHTHNAHIKMIAMQLKTVVDFKLSSSLTTNVNVVGG